MDWNTLLAPIIIATVPILVMFIKKLIPEASRWILPLLATILGAAADTASRMATGTSYGPAWGAVMGLAGVGLRELVDQLRS